MIFWDFWGPKISSYLEIFWMTKSSSKIELQKLVLDQNRAPKSSSEKSDVGWQIELQNRAPKSDFWMKIWSFFERLPKIIKKSRPARSKKWLLDWKSRFSPKNHQKTIKNWSFFELFWKSIQNPSKKYAKGSYTSVGV